MAPRTAEPGGVTVERRFAAPRELVWALLADTNRYNRALGFSPPHYTWREIDGRRTRVADATQGGVSMSWVEDPYEWIEGARLEGRRTFLSGPASTGGLLVELEDHEDAGCIARVTASGTTRSLILRLLGPLVQAHLRRGLTRYLDAITEVVQGCEPSSDDTSQPPSVRAQAVLAGLDNAVASGEHTA